MKGLFFKIIVGLLLAALLLSAGYQIWSIAAPRVDVEQALLYTSYNDIMATGYFIRDEIVLQKNGEGIYDYVIADGRRVKKGGAVAVLYKSSAQADISVKISKLDSQIAMLEKSMVGSAPIGTVEITKLEQSISAAVSAIARSGARGNGVAALRAKDELTILLNKKSLMLGEFESFDDLIYQLKEEKRALEKQVSGNSLTFTSPESGIFVSAVDGFEGILKTDMADSLTPADFEALSSITVDASAGDFTLGKIITGFEWYFASVVPESAVEDLAQRDSVRLRLPFAADLNVPADVTYIGPAVDGECVLVVKSSYELPELNYMRNQTIQIVKEQITGLKIDKKALHIVDGERGVYVRGAVLKWKPVEILFSKDNYYIVKYDNPKNSQLQLYDAVVVSGKDLYDGKVMA